MKKLLVRVGIVGILAAMLFITASAATPKFQAEANPTIKYILGEDGMQRISDEEFYGKFVFDAKDKKSTEVAAEVKQEIEKPMLRFYFNEDGLYSLNEAQYQEGLTKNNFAEIILRDDLLAVEFEDNAEVTDVLEPVSILTRTSGSWKITDHVIRDGYRTTFAMPGGDSFVVDDGEEVKFSIEPDTACWLKFGSTGTKDYTNSAYVDKVNWFGITIVTDTPGSYKFFAANTENGFDVTVNGVIEVS